MAGTDIADTLLVAGQNEGIETAVLPPPQMLSVSNMRLRKSSRWGKRFGHTSLSVVNLGTGSGLNRAVGGGKGNALTCFALTDDRCSVYDQTAASFVVPSGPKLGAASGWLPDTSFFPVPARSLQFQTSTPCSNCYAFGYLWTVIQYTDPTATGDNLLRLVATDPNDQTVIRIDDFTPTTAGFGGNSYPKLNLVGSTLMLTYTVGKAGTRSVAGRTITGIGGTWSGESTLLTLVGLVYDANTYSTTRLAVSVAAAAGSSVTLYSTAFAVGPTQAIVDASGNPLTEISVVGTSTVAAGEIYVGYACAATPAIKVIVFTANLAGTVGTAVVSAGTTRPLLALQPTGGVVVVYGQNITTSIGAFSIGNVTAAAALGGGSFAQRSLFPISMPFNVGSSTYIWTKTEYGGASSASYATLVRLVVGTFVTLEMSSQDFLVSTGQAVAGIFDQRGLPAVARIGTSAAYAAPVPTLYAVPSAVATGHDFRTMQVKHYTDSANRRGLSPLYADSSSFLPMGALTRVDDRGPIEEGFLHTPTIGAITPAAGAGSLVPLSDYYYTAIYKSRNSNGRFEVSAPSNPFKISMGAGQNQNTVSVVSLGLTARSNVTIEVYRTLSNTQTFYLVAVIDSGTGVVTFLDQLSDSLAAQQPALYTQVGQTLANSFPPPARFGCVGGQRIFLGGLIRPDIVQASKLMFGDQSPSFADSDGFRIVFPAPVTGLAWMDALVIFTTEGIYITSGDGPDDSGVGDFGNITRMPYEIGCIEPRSVVVVDDGCFFQTARGIYLLPRGFGAPVPAGDNVQDTLALYPVITGTAVLTKSTEQSVHWTCSDTASLGGARIVYDLAHKAWSVDTVNGTAPCGAGQWSGNEVVMFQSALSSTVPLALTNATYSDAGLPIAIVLATGDLRPFGVTSEGVISKLQLLAELRSACSLDIFRSTEWGSNSATRAFTLAAGDYQIGQITVTEAELGNGELRNAMRLRVAFQESSTSEGLAFIAMSLEHEQGQGLKRVFPLSMVT
jgi:hypothetical protein